MMKYALNLVQDHLNIKGIHLLIPIIKRHRKPMTQMETKEARLILDIIMMIKGTTMNTTIRGFC